MQRGYLTQFFILYLKGKVKKVALTELHGYVSAVMILPYPPGIPVIFPGEKITN
jgi:lysine decarboxylase